MSEQTDNHPKSDGGSDKTTGGGGDAPERQRDTSLTRATAERQDRRVPARRRWAVSAPATR